MLIYDFDLIYSLNGAPIANIWTYFKIFYKIMRDCCPLYKIMRDCCPLYKIMKMYTNFYKIWKDFVLLYKKWSRFIKISCQIPVGVLAVCGKGPQ